jgi:predicted GNAT family N-acyltransferase
MSNIDVDVVPYAEADQAIQHIRHLVFQVEQNIEPELDFDGQDETAMHVIAYCATEPIGTARIRYLNERLAKIERVAVLAAYRGQGVGKVIMTRAIAYLDHQTVPEIKINAQVQVKDFYQKLGFRQVGELFYEAGLPHIEMKRSHDLLKL